MEMNDFNWILDDIDPSVNLPSILQNPDKNDMEEQEKERFKQDTEFRKHFSNWVMSIVPTWLGLTMVLLFLTGFGCTRFSDTVVVALLTTTTANVLGLAFIVLKGMFPEGNIKNE